LEGRGGKAGRDGEDKELGGWGRLEEDADGKPDCEELAGKKSDEGIAGGNAGKS
jgi:hypothetical protein